MKNSRMTHGPQQGSNPSVVTLFFGFKDGGTTDVRSSPLSVVKSDPFSRYFFCFGQSPYRTIYVHTRPDRFRKSFRERLPYCKRVTGLTSPLSQSGTFRDPLSLPGPRRHTDHKLLGAHTKIQDKIHTPLHSFPCQGK